MSANDVVLDVIAAIESAGIPYMLVGSFSSNVYGVPRATQDADLVLQLGDRPVSEIRQLLGPGYKLDSEKPSETVNATYRHIITHSGSSFRIELFLLSDDPHDLERFSRRQRMNVGGREVFLPTPEDVVVTKLRWSKLGARRKDVDDVQNVLAVQGDTLDMPYIRRWTDVHGTRELFEKVLEEAGKM